MTETLADLATGGLTVVSNDGGAVYARTTVQLDGNSVTLWRPSALAATDASRLIDAHLARVGAVLQVAAQAAALVRAASSALAALFAVVGLTGALVAGSARALVEAAAWLAAGSALTLALRLVAKPLMRRYVGRRLTPSLRDQPTARCGESP
ncbi:MAG: hypothetical protein FJX56_12370 [Alphaproteobacteria bacterium]|nr:hypothetical protein [Alphaproteobacteria bacterium]